MLVHIKDLVTASAQGKYILGAFNIHNLETALGVARAAQDMKSPVIIQVSESTIEYAGLKPITHIVTSIAKSMVPDIPVALHLDHGRSFESVSECISAGFSSVHIDASAKPLDENIAVTKQVVEYAHKKKVWVQGEVGVIVGGHGEVGSIDPSDVPLADSEQVRHFVRETGVDTVSAAVGTAHGIFDNEKIHFDLLEEIISGVDIPFILHGGSGVKDDDVRKVLKLGVRIINIGTGVKVAFTRRLIREAKSHSRETDPRRLLNPAIQAVKEVVAEKIQLFGSGGKIN